MKFTQWRKRMIRDRDEHESEWGRVIKGTQRAGGEGPSACMMTSLRMNSGTETEKGSEAEKREEMQASGPGVSNDYSKELSYLRVQRS